MVYNIGPKAVLAGSGIVLSAMLVLFIFTKNTDIPDISEANKNIVTYKDKFIGFPDDVTTQITYLDSKNNVHYTLKDTQNNYIDAEILVNKQSGIVSTSLSGLKTTTKISLIFDNTNYESSVPVDWSGRLTLEANNINFEQTKVICLLLENSNFQKTPMICHNTGTIHESEVLS